MAASLRNADPAQEEVAHGLGAGRLRTFWRITLGQARVAILGGCLLVVLVLLAEYGAFEILGYQTFTTEIFTEFSQAFNIAAASALSLVLVALGLVVLAGESLARGRGRVNRVDRMAQHRTDRLRLGRWTGIVLLALLALVLLALGPPRGLGDLLVGRGRPARARRRLDPQRRRAYGPLRRLRRGGRDPHGAPGGHPRHPLRRPTCAGCSSAAPISCWPCPDW